MVITDEWVADHEPLLVGGGPDNIMRDYFANPFPISARDISFLWHDIDVDPSVFFDADGNWKTLPVKGVGRVPLPEVSRYGAWSCFVEVPYVARRDTGRRQTKVEKAVEDVGRILIGLPYDAHATPRVLWTIDEENIYVMRLRRRKSMRDLFFGISCFAESVDTDVYASPHVSRAFSDFVCGKKYPFALAVTGDLYWAETLLDTWGYREIEPRQPLIALREEISEPVMSSDIKDSAAQLVTQQVPSRSTSELWMSNPKELVKKLSARRQKPFASTPLLRLDVFVKLLPYLRESDGPGVYIVRTFDANDKGQFASSAREYSSVFIKQSERVFEDAAKQIDWVCGGHVYEDSGFGWRVDDARQTFVNFIRCEAPEMTIVECALIDYFGRLDGFDCFNRDVIWTYARLGSRFLNCDPRRLEYREGRKGAALAFMDALIDESVDPSQREPYARKRCADAGPHAGA